MVQTELRPIAGQIISKLIYSSGYIAYYVFHDGGRCHIETSPLICSANQWTGFYMITASIMKG